MCLPLYWLTAACPKKASFVLVKQTRQARQVSIEQHPHVYPGLFTMLLLSSLPFPTQAEYCRVRMGQILHRFICDHHLILTAMKSCGSQMTTTEGEKQCIYYTINMRISGTSPLQITWREIVVYVITKPFGNQTIHQTY